MNTRNVQSQHFRLYQTLRCFNANIANFYFLTVWELEFLPFAIVVLEFFQFFLVIHGKIATLFLDLFSDFFFASRLEMQSIFSQMFGHVLSQVPSGYGESARCVLEAISVIDHDYMRNPVSTIADQPRCSPTCVECQNGLGTNVEGRNLEFLEENTCHFLPVLFWIEGGFSQHHRLGFWVCFYLLVVYVVPYFLHIVPVIYYPVL